MDNRDATAFVPSKFWQQRSPVYSLKISYGSDFIDAKGGSPFRRHPHKGISNSSTMYHWLISGMLLSHRQAYPPYPEREKERWWRSTNYALQLLFSLYYNFQYQPMQILNQRKWRSQLHNHGRNNSTHFCTWICRRHSSKLAIYIMIGPTAAMSTYFRSNLVFYYTTSSGTTVRTFLTSNFPNVRWEVCHVSRVPRIKSTRSRGTHDVGAEKYIYGITVMAKRK